MRNKKIKKCAEWLAYCLEIGWSKNDLDGLQELWMANHDDNGNYKAQLQQHSVMQAEGSDVSEGAAVGQRSVDTVAARGHIHKWHETSAKERICYMCGETEKTGAGSSHEGQP